MVIASHRDVKLARDAHISYSDSILDQKRSFKYLGVILDDLLCWNSHISFVSPCAYPQRKLLNRISSFLDPTSPLKIYKLTILPILGCGFTVWGSCSKKNSDF